MKPSPPQIASFTTDLRNAITTLGEALPDAERYFAEHLGEHYADQAYAYAFRLNANPLMDEFLQIATLLDSHSSSWPTDLERSNMSRGHTFVDDWPLPYEAPITLQLFRVDQVFRNLDEPPPLPPDGLPVLDPAAIACYREWRPAFDRIQQAKQDAFLLRSEAIKRNRP